jgi:hypothetical protein
LCSTNMAPGGVGDCRKCKAWKQVRSSCNSTAISLPERQEAISWWWHWMSVSSLSRTLEDLGSNFCPKLANLSLRRSRWPYKTNAGIWLELDAIGLFHIV